MSDDENAAVEVADEPTDETTASVAWRERRANTRRSISESMDRLSQRQLHIIREEVEAFPWSDYPRPKTRGDCLEGGINAQRPCPFVTCKHHLVIDINTKTGAVIDNFPGIDPTEWPQTCALDVADRGGVPLEEVGAAMNITRERVRQLESISTRKLSMHRDAPELRETLLDGLLEESLAARAIAVRTKESKMTEAEEKPVCAWKLGCSFAATPGTPPSLSGYCPRHRAVIRSTQWAATQEGFDFADVGYPSMQPKRTQFAREVCDPVESPPVDAGDAVTVTHEEPSGTHAANADETTATLESHEDPGKRPFACEEYELLRTELRRRREAAGMYQKHLAEKSGVSVGVIGSLESGHKACSARDARRFDAALGTGTLFQSLARAVAMKRWDEGTLHGDGGWNSKR